MRYLGFIVFITLVLIACADKQESMAKQAVDAKKQVTDTKENVIAVVAKKNNSEQAALLKKGEVLFLRCRSCHSLEPDGINLMGPNLYGLFGATAGKKEGYAFSTHLSESGIVWDEETLDEWIENPQALVAGNKMIFTGLADAIERKAVIAYLKENTH